MLQRKTIWLLAVVFLLTILSCTRLEAPPQGVRLVGTEKLPALDSIPLEWGKLVSVSTIPKYEGVFQLWFQDGNGKVRMVAFSLKELRLIPDAVVVPRK
ncbi:MAG: hypothetical protein WCO26_22460 [Deltaproteobacteria bacterium]